MVYILVLERVASHPLATLAEKYSVLSTVLQYYLVQYLSVYVQYYKYYILLAQCVWFKVSK